MTVTNVTKDQLVHSLAHYEEIAHQGLSTAWQALVVIRNNQLYTERGYQNFGDYCKSTFDYSIRTVRRQLTHVETCQLLEEKTGTKPDKESHSRELAPLSDEKKVQVWGQVQDRVQETHEPVTSGLIQEVKTQVVGLPPKKNTFTKTFARVVHDYREAIAVSGEEREELRLMIVAFLSEIDNDSGIVAAA